MIASSRPLAVFDLDGTLINSLADLAEATNHALAACGFPTHPLDAYRYFVGNGIGKLFERALPPEARTAPHQEAVRREFLPYYTAHGTDHTCPYPGIPRLLAHLSSRGWLLAVASNKYQEATLRLVQQFFGSLPWACIYGQREGVPAKPDPTVVRCIMQETGADPCRTVYIGDSCVDMQTGAAAGVHTVGVSWGFRPRTELEALRPAFVADTVEQLQAHLAAFLSDAG